MPRLDKPYWITTSLFGLMLLFPMALPQSFKVDEIKNPLFTAFPLELGPWKGKETPLDERTYEILETRNVLSRIYENPEGKKVHLLLVGSHKDRRVAHPPEVCYLSSNYMIVSAGAAQLKIKEQQIPVKEFVAKSERNPSDEESVLYLYKVGDRYTTNYYAQQLQFAWDRLGRRDSQVLLIRLAGVDKNVFEDLLTRVLSETETRK